MGRITMDLLFNELASPEYKSRLPAYVTSPINEVLNKFKFMCEQHKRTIDDYNEICPGSPHKIDVVNQHQLLITAIETLTIVLEQAHTSYDKGENGYTRKP